MVCLLQLLYALAVDFLLCLILHLAQFLNDFAESQVLRHHLLKTVSLVLQRARVNEILIELKQLLDFLFFLDDLLIELLDKGNHGILDFAACFQIVKSSLIAFVPCIWNGLYFVLAGSPLHSLFHLVLDVKALCQVGQDLLGFARRADLQAPGRLIKAMLACYQQLLHGDQLRLELVGEFFEVLGVLLPSLGVECNFLFTQPRFHKFIFMKGNTTKRVQALFLIFFSLFSAFVTLLYDPPLRNYSKAEIMQAREKMQATRGILIVS